MFTGIGSFELLIILLVVLILFGSKQLPQAARIIGKGIRDLQHASQSVRDEIQKTMMMDEDQDNNKKPQG